MSNSVAHRWPAMPEASAFTRRALDLVEKVVLLIFFTYFLIPMIGSVWQHADAGAALLMFSESLEVGLVLIRKPAQNLSQRPLDWGLAFGATLMPTLFRPSPGAPAWLGEIATVVMVGGICFQIYSKVTLGRSFGVVAANCGIRATGPYRLVRHPIYLGYALTHFGFLCASFSRWNLAMFTLTYALMIPRIFAEERLLRRDAQYAAYCHQVRWRLIPGIL